LDPLASSLARVVVHFDVVEVSLSRPKQRMMPEHSNRWRVSVGVRRDATDRVTGVQPGSANLIGSARAPAWARPADWAVLVVHSRVLQSKRTASKTLPLP